MPTDVNPSFRRRCESALTHPVTLAALGALLLNDLLFKALWRNPWTTGKLSDLAWVIFASPLLAFLLSLAARGNRTAERAAFAAAYIGLPILYAVFNTFAPVHDAILRALSLAGGTGAGSPLDPTDSLVIPLGLAAAIWVWRREPAGAGSLRTRLGLLTAAVAALASVATSYPDPEVGVTSVEIKADGTTTYIYNEWRYNEWRKPALDQEEEVVGDSQSAETPRGTYSIEGAYIMRTRDGRREVAYSAAYLQEAGNINVQTRATQSLGRRWITTEPYAIVYEERTGNVIVAMGLQGVVIGTPDGQWKREAVGKYAPTNFSIIRKALLLLDWQLWLLALALSLSFTALAMALAFPTALRLVFAALAIIPSVASALWFNGVGGSGDPWSVETALGLGLDALMATVTAVISLWPSVITLAMSMPQLMLKYPSEIRGRLWRVTIAAFAAMHALIALSFLLWAQLGIDFFLANASAVALVAIAAIILAKYLADKKPPEPKKPSKPKKSPEPTICPCGCGRKTHH